MVDKPLLRLDDATPNVIALHRRVQVSGARQVVRTLLTPLAYVYLRLLERRRRWSTGGLSLHGLRFDRGAIEGGLSVGHSRVTWRFLIRRRHIESIVIRFDPEGQRRVGLELRVHYRQGQALTEARIGFSVHDVDTHEEATCLVFQIARALGSDWYRVREHGDGALALELMFDDDAHDRGTKTPYRLAARPTGVFEIPDSGVLDPQPRHHGKFVEPEGTELAAFEQAADRGFHVDVFEPGKRVVLGERPRPWRLLAVLLFPFGWVIAWCLYAAYAGLFACVLIGILAIAASTVGIDLWFLMSNEISMVVFQLGCAIAGFVTVAPIVWEAVQSALGSRIDLDWGQQQVRHMRPLSKTTFPLAHVDGITVRRSRFKLRLVVQLHDGDLPVVAGGDEIIALAVDLARSLDVPVSLPPG
jgi:hypothetical protein